MRFRWIGAALLLAPILLVARCATAPHAEAEVPWPDPDVTVRVQIRGLLSEDWWIAVRTDGGGYRREMWTNWGPARRANIYRTEAGGLAVIGAGMLAAMVDLPPRGGPREDRRYPPPDAERWRYLGVVASGHGPLRFIPAEAAPECVPLYGVGEVPIRHAHQERPGEYSCP